AWKVVGVNDNVAALAVLTGDAHERGRRARDAIRQSHRVLRAVQCGANVVAHAAIDTHVLADRGAVDEHIFNSADRVEGRRGGPDDGAARLDRDNGQRDAERLGLSRHDRRDRRRDLLEVARLVGARVGDTETAAQVELWNG